MAKKTYKLNGETGVTVFRDGQPPIRIDAGSDYATDDPDEQTALDASTHVTEVKQAASKRESRKRDDN